MTTQYLLRVLLSHSTVFGSILKFSLKPLSQHSPADRRAHSRDGRLRLLGVIEIDGQNVKEEGK